MIWNRLTYYRKLRPDDPAVVLNDQAVSYRRFCGDIARMSDSLKLRLPEGATTVGIDIAHPYLHWLCVLGLWRLRIASASLSKQFDLEVVGADVAISDRPIDAQIPVLIAGQDWLDRPVDPVHFAARQHEDSFVARVLGSSGTTGRPKRLSLSSDTIFGRALHMGLDFGLSAHDRLIMGMGMASLGGYQMPINIWLQGGTVILADDPLRGSHLPAQLRPNLAVLSTGNYEQLINQTPQGGAPAYPQVRFMIGGSAVAPQVIARGRERLSPQLEIMYGSTEVGIATLVDAARAAPTAVGYAMPYVDIEAVDDADQPVKPGEEGRIRMRTPFFADYADPDDAAKAYRDGWFYPGDVGVIAGDGMVQIVGRSDDVFNLGGRKIAAGRIEDVALSCPGVREAASCAMAHEQLGVVVGIVVTTGDGYSHDQTLAIVREQLGRKRFLVYEAPAIPRNEMGKIRRHALPALILELQAKAEAAASRAGEDVEA